MPDAGDTAQKGGDRRISAVCGIHMNHVRAQLPYQPTKADNKHKPGYDRLNGLDIGLNTAWLEPFPKSEGANWNDRTFYACTVRQFLKLPIPWQYNPNPMPSVVKELCCVE